MPEYRRFRTRQCGVVREARPGGRNEGGDETAVSGGDRRRAARPGPGRARWPGVCARTRAAYDASGPDPGSGVDAHQGVGALTPADHTAGDGGRRADPCRHHLLRDLPQRPGQGRRAVVCELRRDEGARAARGHREDDPQAARRDDAAAGRQAPRGHRDRSTRRGARVAHGRVRGQQPQPGLAAVPAPDPRRVHRMRCRTCSTSRST